MRPQVLVVCTANICRSPAGARLLSGPQESRQLELADIRASMLILTASQRHRAAVIEMRPSAQVRTFTLAQAARIARHRHAAAQVSMPDGADMPDRLLWLAEELDANRATAPRPDDPNGDELPDPHAGARHADVFTNLLAAVDGFCAPLLGQPLPR
jgi:protein-tyrosine-phosphatase